jgi:hypothetical protein
MIEVRSWSAILKLSILFCRFSEAFSAEFIREYERKNKCDDDKLCTQISNIVSIFLLQYMEMQELGIWRFLRIRRWNARDWVQDSSWEYPSRGKCWISTPVFKSVLLGLLHPSGQYPSFCSFISAQILFFSWHGFSQLFFRSSLERIESQIDMSSQQKWRNLCAVTFQIHVIKSAAEEEQVCNWGVVAFSCTLCK